jgi:hypothetical protein
LDIQTLRVPIASLPYSRSPIDHTSRAGEAGIAGKGPVSQTHLLRYIRRIYYDEISLCNVFQSLNLRSSHICRLVPESSKRVSKPDTPTREDVQVR